MDLSIFDIDELTGVNADELLSKAEPIHRELRAGLPSEYVALMNRVFRGGGRMIVATASQDSPCCVGDFGNVRPG